jgi:hypothetical protein
LINGSIKASLRNVRLGTGADHKATLLFNGSVKVSIRTLADKPTELSFDLRPADKSPKKHMVWIPDPPTGTHIGAAGHWAQVDENGVIIDSNKTDVEKMGSNYAKQLELSGTRPIHDPAGSGVPGH